jgi:hypothetical protein
MALSHAPASVRVLVKRWQGSCGLGYGAAKGMNWGADAVTESGRPCLRRRYRESSWDPARSESLGTHGDLHAREPGGPVVARGPLFDASSRMVRGVAHSGMVGREGNAVAVSPR